MKKLSDIVMELGKVQTAKDNPPFKTPQQIEKEAIANPINQKYDFKKPTMISMSSRDMKTLHQDGTIEINGITIVYEK
jgi:hypothetical protein|tara:strand:+ start:42 stop:275 length:234 start_codon:yes stop_codon:yes gene_type:complete